MKRERPEGIQSRYVLEISLEQDLCSHEVVYYQPESEEVQCKDCDLKMTKRGWRASKVSTTISNWERPPSEIDEYRPVLKCNHAIQMMCYQEDISLICILCNKSYVGKIEDLLRG